MRFEYLKGKRYCLTQRLKCLNHTVHPHIFSSKHFRPTIHNMPTSTYNTQDETDNLSLTIIISSVVIGLAAVVVLIITVVCARRRHKNNIRFSSGISQTDECHMSDTINASQDLTQKKSSDETSKIQRYVNCQVNLDTKVNEDGVAPHKKESKANNSLCVAEIYNTSRTNTHVQQNNVLFNEGEEGNCTSQSCKSHHTYTNIHCYGNVSDFKLGKEVLDPC